MALAAAVVASMLAPAAWAAADDVTTSLTSQRIQQLADAGEFDALLKDLKTGNATDKGPYTRELVQSLEQYVQNEQARVAWRKQAFDNAVEKMNKELDEGKLEDGLVDAIDAKSHAVDQGEFIKSDKVVQLTARSVEAAQKAEQAGDWVQAMAYYRLLDLLFSDSRLYREDVDRTAQHVRVLQLYAPEHLKQLIEEQRKRRGVESDDETPDTVSEKWSDRLAGIDMDMLSQALPMIAAAHVDSPDLAVMLQGGVDSLITMLDTPNLDATFPSLGKPQQVQRFRDLLMNLRMSLSQPGRQVDLEEAQAIIGRIVAMNQLTVFLPEPVMVYELTQGMIGTLDDFTAMIWPEDLDVFTRTIEGKFSGVGIQISRQDGQLVVIAPLPNTPAQRAGIKAGDIIAQVDGRDTSAWSLDRAVREITGPEGEEVVLGIRREPNPELMTFPIRRASIHIESVRGWEVNEGGGWNFVLDPDAGIGYVRIDQFMPETPDELDKALSALQKQGKLNGLVIDLRYDPGGRLDAAVKIADRFVDEGAIVSTVDAKGKETDRFDAHKASTLEDLPIVVLVNAGSASASEIVSGALQDHRRALILGHRSFGKGSVQNIFSIDHNKALLKLTTQYYQLPSGRIIHRKQGSKIWGIQPDLTISLSDREAARLMDFRREMDVWRDPQKALTTAQMDEQIKAKLDKLTDDSEPGRAAFERLLLTGSVNDMLIKGLDPQLEAAQIILQAKLASQEFPAGTSVAEQTAGRPATVTP